MHHCLIVCHVCVSFNEDCFYAILERDRWRNSLGIDDWRMLDIKYQNQSGHFRILFLSATKNLSTFYPFTDFHAFVWAGCERGRYADSEKSTNNPHYNPKFPL